MSVSNHQIPIQANFMDQERPTNQNHASAGMNEIHQSEPIDIASKPTVARSGLFTKLWLTLFTEVTNVQLRLRLVNVILQFCPTTSFSRFRTGLYRLCGMEIGRSSLLLGNLNLSGVGPIFRRLKVGQLCLLNAPLHLDLNAPITIGDRSSIGHHVIFITTEHEIGPADHRCGAPVFKPITIGNGCWIGACVTILPGVTIGDGCVVSAGSVVSTPVPPNKLVAGNPARPIKSLDA